MVWTECALLPPNAYAETLISPETGSGGELFGEVIRFTLGHREGPHNGILVRE